VIAVDLRGRAESGYAKDAMSYVPLTYVQDIEALLGELKIDRFAMIGTSLGGIVTMLLAGPERGRLAGALINDVGPVIEPGGLSRIRGYVGKASSWPTWLHAARAVQDSNRDVYPDWGLEQWLDMAKRLYRLNSSGRVVLDYDLRIAEPFRVPGAEAGPDMWSALAGLAGLPVTVIRGGRSDLLGADTAARMIEALPGAELATIPNVGHAPTLSEPEAEAAIGRLLARLV
jgi:pimeloyl-ACP methyl ester carboxylesterase